MNEPSVIDDVRAAKAWVDMQSADLQEVGDRLRTLEQSYQSRSGVFASVPRQQPEWVRCAIQSAQLEPGAEFLKDARS